MFFEGPSVSLVGMQTCTWKKPMRHLTFLNVTYSFAARFRSDFELTMRSLMQSLGDKDVATKYSCSRRKSLRELMLPKWNGTTSLWNGWLQTQKWHSVTWSQLFLYAQLLGQHLSGDICMRWRTFSALLRQFFPELRWGNITSRILGVPCGNLWWMTTSSLLNIFSTKLLFS